MIAIFERFEIVMTLAQAESASHPGKCDDDVFSLSRIPSIARKLASIPPDDIRAELGGYGAWSAAELADDNANKQRILWLAAGNISEGHS